MHRSVCRRVIRPICHGPRSCIRCIPRRCYSTALHDEGPIRIEVGSSGAVTVDLFQPLTTSSSSPPSSFIFYLPRGPIPFSASSSIPPEPTDLRPLASSANAVVARINYRLASGNDARYPLPIHDVGKAWNWLFGLRMSQAPTTAGIGPRYLPPIGVCGEFIGGSLATMLAMTECHARPLPGITAAYVGNPIIDWTAMGAPKGTTDNSGTGSTKTAAPSSESKAAKQASSWDRFANAPELGSSRLLPLRQKLFANSSYWFDNFASPLLFFRTPSQPEPDASAEEYEAFEAVMKAATEATEQGQSDDGDVGDRERAAKFRVSHKRWPPLRSGLILPDVHVTLGEENPVRDQGVDLVRLMNRSVFHYEQDKAGTLEEVDRATREDRPGAGAWDGEELIRIGEWFKATFRYK